MIAGSEIQPLYDSIIEVHRNLPNQVYKTNGLINSYNKLCEEGYVYKEKDYFEGINKIEPLDKFNQLQEKREDYWQRASEKLSEIELNLSKLYSKIYIGATIKRADATKRLSVQQSMSNSQNQNSGNSYLSHNRGSTLSGNFNIQGTQLVQEGSVYPAPEKNDFLLEYISRLLKNIPDKILHALGIISTFGGLFTMIIPTILFQLKIILFDFSVIFQSMFIGFGISLIGFLFINLYKYRRDATCINCGQSYTMAEIPNSAKEFPNKLIERFYKCKNCGHEETRKDTNY